MPTVQLRAAACTERRSQRKRRASPKSPGGWLISSSCLPGGGDGVQGDASATQNMEGGFLEEVVVEIFSAPDHFHPIGTANGPCTITAPRWLFVEMIQRYLLACRC